MADVRVTKQFKDDFDTWAEDKLHYKDFSQAEIDELKAMLRIEFAEGPDQFRKDYTILNAKGVEIPAAIDDHGERYRVWAAYFGDEANQIRKRYARKAA